MIETCYVTRLVAQAALEEAALNGLDEIAQVLIDAGALPNAILAHKGGKTPFHLACETGNSRVAKVLLQGMPSREAAEQRCDQGHTALQLARSNDLGFMAKQLDKALDAKFGPRVESS